ncbi:MAG: formate dehydrogenase, gamma subunit [Hyphomicrobiales bacterium]|nr:formate dehydrogenase, gamma subunit [Hyphomicrobiales bacterium]
MTRPDLNRRKGFCSALLALSVLWLLSLSPDMASAQQQQSQPVRPTAESVNEAELFKQNSRIEGRVTIPDGKAAFLEQPQGREWRGFHEGWMPWIAGVAILGMLLGLLVFYFVRGTIRLEPSERSRATILRFNGLERFTHWTVAVSFLTLGLTGLNYIFGKRLLMPLMGADAFGDFSQWSKYLHNAVAWPFALGVLVMFVIWVRDNVPRRVDWEWIKVGGGLFGGSRTPSAGRFNAGQKLMFWGVIVAGFAMIVTGLQLVFPFSLTDVNGMQLTQSLHSLIGALFFAAILAHIYIGTVGMEGAFWAMGTGEVDLAWARHHHDLWVQEQLGRAPEPHRPGAAGVAPTRAPDVGGP